MFVSKTKTEIKLRTYLVQTHSYFKPVAPSHAQVTNVSSKSHFNTYCISISLAYLISFLMQHCFNVFIIVYVRTFTDVTFCDSYALCPADGALFSWTNGI